MKYAEQIPLRQAIGHFRTGKSRMQVAELLTDGEVPLPESLENVSKETMWHYMLYLAIENERLWQDYRSSREGMQNAWGKREILRHENNQLRKKVTTQAERQKIRAPYSPPEPPDVSL